MKNFFIKSALASLLFLGLSLFTPALSQELRNSSGSQTGKMDSDGTVRNSSGSKIGKIDSDGTVRNSSGSKIGSIDKDGTLRNDSGSKIGSASGIKKEWA